MSLNEYQVIPVLEGLKKLQAIAQTNPKELNSGVGICFYLNKFCSNKLFDLEYRLVSKLSENWSKHSGDKYYPVSGDVGLGNWTGNSLTLRLELIEYLVKQIESCEDNIMLGLCLKEMVK